MNQTEIKEIKQQIDSTRALLRWVSGTKHSQEFLDKAQINLDNISAILALYLKRED